MISWRHPRRTSWSFTKEKVVVDTIRKISNQFNWKLYLFLHLIRCIGERLFCDRKRYVGIEFTLLDWFFFFVKYFSLIVTLNIICLILRINVQVRTQRILSEIREPFSSFTTTCMSSLRLIDWKLNLYSWLFFTCQRG